MTRPTPLDVRYGADHDVQLRDALFEAWDRKCHVCRRPKQFHEIQVDHLIPQAIEESKKRELIVAHELPADFDLNRPANLAPACAAPCNGEPVDGVGARAAELVTAVG